MNHAITIGDVLVFMGIGIGVVVVLAICIAVLAAIAKGYRH